MDIKYLCSALVFSHDQMSGSLAGGIAMGFGLFHALVPPLMRPRCEGMPKERGNHMSSNSVACPVNSCL